jgi:DNA-binding IclR family transcriptional regulator
VANAIAILRRLVAQDASMGVNALARAAGVSPSSCFNILKTLVAEGLADFDPVAKTYAPGPGLALFAAQGNDGQRAFAQCAPLLERFADVNGAAMALWGLTASNRLVLLGFAESPSTTRIHMTVGQRLPMLAGAGGRCVAAGLQLDDEAIAQRFDKLRWANPPSLAAFQRQVAETRQRGWAIDDGAFLAGVTTVSAPVGDRAGRVAYVVGATYFRGQRSERELVRVGDDLKDLAGRMTRALSL